MLDLAESGAWIALPTPVSSGATIHLTFEHPDRQVTVTAEARVARCVRLGIPITPPFGLGVEFVEPLGGVLPDRAPRAPVERVPLMLKGADGLRERGVLVNVSGTGLLVVSRSERRPEEQVELELSPDAVSDCPRARLTATVQWVQDGDASGFVAAGLKVADFETHDDRIAFATWVASRITTA